MPQFVYEAISSAGETVSGTIDASSRSDAFRLIESKRLSPLEITEKNQDSSAASSAASKPIRLSRPRLIFFTSELADLIDAGLPVQQALNIMADRQQDPVIRRTGDRLRTLLQDGRPLSSCFRETSRDFDDLYVSLIAAGEASGTLPGVLHRMALSIAQLHEMQRRFTSAMIYPAFMIAACGILMAVFTLVLVPQLTSLLSKTGQDLPAITKGLLAFSDFCSTHFWSMLGSAIAAVVLFRIFIATNQGRLWWDRAKLKIPLVGPIIETRFYAEFTQALGNLVSNGVPLLSSLQLLSRGTPNRFFRDRLGRVVESVSAGEPLSAALRSAGQFQPLMTDIVAIGEQTSHLSKSLLKAASRYDKELDVRIRRLTAMISPVIIIFLAIVVTIIAYCIVSSIFSAVSGIRASEG